MQPSSLRAFLNAKPAYAPGGSLKLYVTAPLAAAIFLAAQVLAGMLYFALGGASTDLVPVAPGGIGPAPGTVTTGQLTVVLYAQILTVVMTMAAAAVSPGGLMRALALGPPAGGTGAYLHAVLLMIPVIAAINLAAYVAKPGDYLADFRIFLETVRADRPAVAALAIGAGAPLSEELLFRGLLLGSAATTGLPFWPAVAIVTAAWTALHIQYSVTGMLEVLAIGLYLAWVLWKTGSLRVPLVCHAVYNSSLFLIMRYLPVA